MTRWNVAIMEGGLMLSLVLGYNAAAFDIGSDQDIGGATPTIAGEGAGNTVVAGGAAPNWTYAWADRAGDGSSNAVATADLNFKGYKLTYTRSPSPSARGTITLDLNGGAITNDADGVSIKVNYVTGVSDSRNREVDHFTVVNACCVSMGGIDTSCTVGGSYSYPYAGTVRIGTADMPIAGDIRVQSVSAINGDAAYGAPGNISIYGLGSVTIAGQLGNLGNLDASANSRNGGYVTVAHQGDLAVADIKTHTTGSGTHSRPGNISLDGGNASGSLSVSNLVAYNLKTGYISAARPLITISRYDTVTIGEIQAYSLHLSDGRASDVTVTNGITGDIAIEGPINLSHGGVITYRGMLQLAAAGTVALAELDMALVRYACLSSGRGKSVIEGELLNFDSSGSGSGTLNDPVVATQNALRVPNGQRLLYAVRNGVNGALEGKVYRVANESGQAGQGGLLMPIPVPGTVLMFF